MNKYWAQGFEKRCQERGVDPNALIKWASDKDERAERDSKDPSGMRPVLRGWGKGVTRGFGAGAGVGALTGGAIGASTGRRRDPLVNGLIGLLAGGAYGGLLGAGVGGYIGSASTARKL